MVVFLPPEVMFIKRSTESFSPTSDFTGRVLQKVAALLLYIRPCRHPELRVVMRGVCSLMSILSCVLCSRAFSRISTPNSDRGSEFLSRL